MVRGTGEMCGAWWWTWCQRRGLGTGALNCDLYQLKAIWGRTIVRACRLAECPAHGASQYQRHPPSRSANNTVPIFSIARRAHGARAVLDLGASMAMPVLAGRPCTASY